MNIVKNRKGITLVALIIAIIVLIILAGIIIMLVHDLIINKAVEASTKNLEASVKEQIELEWTRCEASWWTEQEYGNITKDDYYKVKLKENLEEQKDFKDVSVSGNIDQVIGISLKYKNIDYKFTRTNKGEIGLINYNSEDIHIGDYFYYPVEYSDVFSNKYYSASNGWKVIDDGKMPGTSGQIKITSAGIPAKWNYDGDFYENNRDVVTDLVENFENLTLRNQELDNINGSYFKVEIMADKVYAMTLADLNLAINSIYGETRTLNDTHEIGNDKDLFYIDNENAYYWLATEKTNNAIRIYCVNRGCIYSDADVRMGIKPVISIIQDDE